MKIRKTRDSDLVGETERKSIRPGWRTLLRRSSNFSWQYLVAYFSVVSVDILFGFGRRNFELGEASGYLILGVLVATTTSWAVLKLLGGTLLRTKLARKSTIFTLFTYLFAVLISTVISAILLLFITPANTDLTALFSFDQIIFQVVVIAFLNIAFGLLQDYRNSLSELLQAEASLVLAEEQGMLALQNERAAVIEVMGKVVDLVRKAFPKVLD